MILTTELRRMAEARFQDARALSVAERYDAAMYLCGYAIELALKARICETLGWSWFPSQSAEFQDYRSLQTHNLPVLLEFSGTKLRVNSDYPAAWEAAKQWNSGWRYLPGDYANEETCSKMLDAVSSLMEVI